MASVTTYETAGTWNATITQGETWTPTITATNPDGSAYSISGWTGTLTISQPLAGGRSTTLLTLTVGSGLSIGGSGSNVLTITITSTQSAALPLGQMAWTLMMTDAAGADHPWFSGTLTVVAL